ncbi:MAG: YcgN family cysteine cluster protein [Ectothiorhodospiraceae bacterium]|nr:YcgN family cysteine cluster protein [Ectothiorhodospiraceae bacterium]
MERFWESIALEDMSQSQWESLCDGCGKCCLHKLEDEDNGKVYVCNVACKLLDINTCQCSDYVHRKIKVPECTVLTPDRISEFQWLPETCAYRLLAEDKPLFDWHPLTSGKTASVHNAGISVRGKVVSEKVADDLQHHITDWVL